MEPVKILIVEDERVIAMSLEDELKAMGYRVCGIANSGQQALKSVSSVIPDLVIMDIKIKGSMDGIETAQRLKEIYDIPVIFLTAYSDQNILERAKLTEPLGYILKPFQSRELRSALEIALYKATMEKKIRLLNQELEVKVQQRTRELTEEIANRKLAEKELQHKSDYLLQANKALKSLLDNREAENRAIEENLLLNVKKFALPYIEMIEHKNPGTDIVQLLDLLKNALVNMVSPASKTLFAKYVNLTPQEAKIADLIRYGKNTKEIAALLNIAPSSVSTYRNNIRKKMGLLNSGTNLQTYLNTSS